MWNHGPSVYVARDSSTGIHDMEQLFKTVSIIMQSLGACVASGIWTGLQAYSFRRMDARG